MNFLKSKLSSFPKNPLSSSSKSKTNNSLKDRKKQIFEQIKAWDIQRAKILKKHLQIIEQILQNQQIRVKNSQQYLKTIQAIMIGRLKQLEKYNKNSINTTAFVLMNNNSETYQGHFELLKQLVLFESHKEEQFNKKYIILKEIFSDLCNYLKADEQAISSQVSISPSKNKSRKLVASNTSIDGPQSGDEQNEQDQSSVAILKSSVRYLIDCDLPDIIEQTINNCQQINKAYEAAPGTSNNQDLYILICKFLRNSHLQVQKHRQIAKQLLNLNKDFIERQKKRSTKIKNTLCRWVIQDQNASQALIKQLQKENNQSLIEDYYNLDDMIVNQSLEKEIGSKDLSQYLLYIQVKPFQKAQDLVLFKCDAFYNKKIETQVVITLDKFFHLRKPNMIEPQFSFLVSKQICMVEENQFLVTVYKMQKKIVKVQKQFQFSLQFNIKQDINEFRDKIKQMAICNYEQLDK